MEVMCTASYPVARLAGNASPAELYRVKARIFQKPIGLFCSAHSKMVRKSVSFRSFSPISAMAIGSVCLYEPSKTFV